MPLQNRVTPLGELITHPGRGRVAARYLDAFVHGRRVKAVCWGYPDRSASYRALRDHLAFYPGRVDAAWMDDERVHAQQSDFYGGWITADLVGPFKEPPGTLGW